MARHLKKRNLAKSKFFWLLVLVRCIKCPWRLYKVLKLRMCLDATITDVVDQLENWRQIPADGNDFEAFWGAAAKRP